MRPGTGWFILGFSVLVCQNVFHTKSQNLHSKLHILHKKAMSVQAGKKSIIGGNIDLKKYSMKIKPEDCKDTAKDTCSKFEADEIKEVCINNFNYMLENCKKTCRFCNPLKKEVKECKDVDDRCGSWRKSKENDCLHYTAFMMSVCKKSCQLCGPESKFTDKNELCPVWAPMGVCKLDKKKLHDLCPHSCEKYKNVSPVFTTARPHHTTRHTTHPPVHHTTRPTPVPTPPPRKLTEEEKENLQVAYLEREDELRQWEKERKEQEELKSEVRPNMPTLPPIEVATADTNPAPTAAPNPHPIPAPPADQQRDSVPSGQRNDSLPSDQRYDSTPSDQQFDSRPTGQQLNSTQVQAPKPVPAPDTQPAPVPAPVTQFTPVAAPITEPEQPPASSFATVSDASFSSNNSDSQTQNMENANPEAKINEQNEQREMTNYS